MFTGSPTVAAATCLPLPAHQKQSFLYLILFRIYLFSAAADLLGHGLHAEVTRPQRPETEMTEHAIPRCGP